MGELRADEKIEWNIEETVINLQEVKEGDFHLYNEYLIEIVKAFNGGYFAKVYELIAIGPPATTKKQP